MKADFDHFNFLLVKSDSFYFQRPSILLIKVIVSIFNLQHLKLDATSLRVDKQVHSNIENLRIETDFMVIILTKKVSKERTFWERNKPSTKKQKVTLGVKA